MKKRIKFPIGIQSFEQIRTEDYLYVDKTEHIYNLVNEGKVYFLSRPRRFGKTLLVSTLRSLFEGKRELFKDLWIDKNRDWKWNEHPVVLLDFNEIPYSSPEELSEELIFTIDQYAKKNSICLEARGAATKLKELIIKLKHRTGQNVVVLIDEYDKPIIDFIGKGSGKLEVGLKNRDFLKNFYGVFKGADVASALRFFLMTGVSKFSKVSIFSELNNLYDLTMQEEASDLLGYTQEELISCFPNEIEDLAKKYNVSTNKISEKLKVWYNGYRFSEKDIKVYNPFSILQVFRSLSFKNYWFESGSPSFLVNLLKEKKYFLPNLEDLEVSEEAFSTYEIEDLKPEALLFQTGYLTIKMVNEFLYTLTYPNQEVKSSLSSYLFTKYSEIEEGPERSKIYLLSKYLKEKKYDEFFEVIKSLFASIPYTLSPKKDEAFFHTIFYLMLSVAGVDARSEVLTCRGRIDMLIEFQTSLYIIEFKCNQNPQKGIEQIKQKKYYEKYSAGKKEVYLMGINFSSDNKNVDGWEIEKM